MRDRRTKHVLGLDPWAAAVEHQAQGDEGAIGPFFFRPASGGFRVPGGGSLEVGVGQIVKRDGNRQAEQALDVGEQRRLDLVAVAHQQIGGPVEPDWRHGFEVHVQQFAKGAAFAQPAPGGHLAAWCGHASDQKTRHGVALDAVQADVRQNPADAQPVHGGETGGFDANRAGPGELQRGDIDLGVNRGWRGGGLCRRGLSRLWRARRWRGGWFAGARFGRDEAGGEALREHFDGFRFREHVRLPAKQRLDPGAQARPTGLRQVEMAAKVEQGELADPVAGTLGGDETEREIRFVGGFIPGCRFADEHGGEGERGGARRQEVNIRLWHYIADSRDARLYICGFPYSFRYVAEKALKMG